MVPATALLGAAALRFEGLAATLLAAYVLAVAEVSALVLLLSSWHAVTRVDLAIGEIVVLGVAGAAWWLRGRPGIGLRGLRTTLQGLMRDPAVALLVAVVVVALVYELALVLVTAPNNWDSLSYHLARAAAWLGHGGLFWIPNAPTARMNEFQPGAEELVLYLFAVTGRGALWALPQYLAQLAVMLAVYVLSRRLGYEPRRSLLAALLFATLSLVALEATTAQNDLVAASLVVAGAAFVTRGGLLGAVVGGLAAGIGCGVKLTAVVALPLLFALAALAGRRVLVWFAISAAFSVAAIGIWGYVLNLAETGHVLGHGDGRVAYTAHPSFPGSASTALRVLYRLVDLSGYSSWVLWALAIAGGAAAAVILTMRHAGSSAPQERLKAGAVTALPFVLPALCLVIAGLIHAGARAVHLPVNGTATTVIPFGWQVNRIPNEDVSAFGPLGVGLVATSLVVCWLAWRRHIVRERLVLALALPLFVVVIALGSKYDPWLARFLLVPVALSVPLAAAWFRHRAVAIGVVVVACVTLVLAHVHNQLKPIADASTPPWELSRVKAVDLKWQPGVASGIAALDKLVPPSVCVGALLDPDDPTYLVFGPELRRRVVFLRAPDEEQEANAAGLTAIVVKANDYQDAQGRLRANGWSLRPLSGYFTLASRPGAASTPCSRA
jgi:hypothetical protein